MAPETEAWSSPLALLTRQVTPAGSPLPFTVNKPVRSGGAATLAGSRVQLLMGTWGDLGGFLEEFRAELSSQDFSPSLRNRRWNHSAVLGASEPGDTHPAPLTLKLGVKSVETHRHSVSEHDSVRLLLPLAMKAAGLEWAETPLPCAI